MRNNEEGDQAESSLPPHPPCPFCETRETELVSPFGGQLTVATYWCNRCRTGFDYIKWEDDGNIDPLNR